MPTVHDIAGTDEVEIVHTHDSGGEFVALYLPGPIALFFEGRNEENRANVLGFLDQMAAVRKELSV
jgi:hypothetical protein